MTTLKNGLIIDETSYNSPNYSPGRPSGVIGATIHWWGLPEWRQKFDQVASYLSQPRGAASTSANYVISDDRVACLVSPDNRAWHALAGNEQTVGLELDPNGGEGTLENAAQVIAMLEDYYGKSLTIYPHNFWVATQCPGHFAAKLDWLVARVNELAGDGGAAEVAVAPPVPAVLEAAPPKPIAQPVWLVEKGDTLSKIARHYKGTAARWALDAIAAENGIGVDSPLQVGQAIRIPSPLVWVVDPGDTWESIADYYAFDSDYLKSINPGVELAPGVVLQIW